MRHRKTGLAAPVPAINLPRKEATCAFCVEGFKLDGTEHVVPSGRVPCLEALKGGR